MTKSLALFAMLVLSACGGPNYYEAQKLDTIEAYDAVSNTWTGAPTRIAGVATCPSLLSSLSMHTYTTYNRPGCSRQPEKRYVKFPAPGSSGCASFVS